MFDNILLTTTNYFSNLPNFSSVMGSVCKILLIIHRNIIIYDY